MRSFVQSVKSFFGGKKKDDEDEEEEEQQRAGEKDKTKFTMSCKKKKKKKPTPKKSAESVKKTTPVKRQLTPASSRVQASTRVPKSISKSPDTAKLPDEPKNVSVRLEKKRSNEKVVSQSSDMPKSTATRPVQSRSFDTPSRGSNESTSSIRKIREFSARALRKVKTFVSRPVKQSTLKKVADRVEQRKKLEQKQQTTHPLTHGEDMFPKQKAPAPKRTKSNRSEVFAPVQSEAVEKNIVKVGTLPSGTVLVKNNDNGGQLFVEGRKGAMCPFWTASRRPTDEDMLDSDTEDDLQLNADVVLDVMNGKVKLVNMPSVPVVLDPINEIKQLQERDKVFFNRDILFGNTVRTMINLSDQDSQRTTPRRRRPESEELNVTEPTEYLSYKLGNWTQFNREAFSTSKKYD